MMMPERVLVRFLHNIIMNFLVFICCCTLFVSFSKQQSSDKLVIRKISTGAVRGRAIPIGGGSAFIFAGIPYARAPSAQLRFRSPQPPSRWEHVRDATRQGPSCWFNTSFMSGPDEQYPMAEDCLLVNVFASERCLHRGGCPVFHYIYGGQFMFGTTHKLDEQTIGENFCSPGRDLVVVTFGKTYAIHSNKTSSLASGYRMNVFGLLNLNYRLHELNPPNMAVHDIVASLRWTQREIANFGGDPRRVTLGGHSSGSVATQILSVCPRANALFQQTISLSGPGTIEMLPKNRNQRSSRRLALLVGCVSAEEWRSQQFWALEANIARVLQCLRSFSAPQINEALPLLEAESLFFHGLSTEIGPEGIITDTFARLLSQNSGAHRTLTGTVSKEFKDGMIIIEPSSGRVDRVRLLLYCHRMVRQLNYENGRRALAECVREYRDATRASFLFDDVNYFLPHLLYALNSVRHNVSDTYLYQFEYDAIGEAYGHPPDKCGCAPARSPRHVQDLVYLFGQNKCRFSAKDRRIQLLHSALFANFIANGTLNDGTLIRNARPFSAERANFYRIDFAKDGARNNWSEFVGDTPAYHRRAFQFWAEHMPRVAGRARMQDDEALIDDQMLSVYLPSDLSHFEQLMGHNLPEAEGTKGVLFCVISLFLLVLLSILLLLGIVTLRWRQRQSYNLLE